MALEFVPGHSCIVIFVSIALAGACSDGSTSRQVVGLSPSPVTGATGPAPISARQDSGSPEATPGPRLVLQNGHTRPIKLLAFSADERHPAVLASADCETVAIWDHVNGRQLDSIRLGGGMPGSMRFSADGRLLAVACGPTVTVWDVERDASWSWTAHDRPVTHVAFNLEASELLSTALDGQIKVWNAATGALLRNKSIGGPIVAATASVDFEKVVLADFDHSVHLVSGRTLATRWSRKTEAAIAAIAIQPHGTRVAIAADDGVLHVWDADTGRTLDARRSHDGQILALSFSQDGRGFVTVGVDQQVLIWTGPNLETRTRWSRGAVGAALSADAELVAIGTGPPSTIALRKVSTGLDVAELGGSATFQSAVAFNPADGSLLTSDMNASVYVWSTSSGRPRPFYQHNASVAALAVRPDGRMVASGGIDRKILIWSPEDASFQVLENDRPIAALVFSPDGRSLVSGDTPPNGVGDRTAALKMWRIDGNGEPIGAARTLAVGREGFDSVSVSRDSVFVAASGGGMAQLVDVASGRELWRDTTGLGHQVAISPDNKLFAVSSTDVLVVRGLHDRLVKWSRTGRFTAVAYSPDGTLIAAANRLSIEIIDAHRGSVVSRFTGHTDRVSALAIRADNQLLASASWDGTTKLWSFGARRQTDSDSPASPLITLATLSSRRARVEQRTDWIAVRPDGRFDANNLEQLTGFAWIFPDQRFRALGSEVYFRNYFEPRVLPRTLAGDAELTAPVLSLANLNRAQPIVLDPQVSVDVDGGHATVRVRVQAVVSANQRDAAGRPMTSGIHDLRLFRDGQLVGWAPRDGVDGEGSGVAGDLSDWRRITRLTAREPHVERVEADGTMVVRFDRVRLPRRRGQRQVIFSAYAFNEERVRSRTATSVVDLNVTAPRQPTAYVVVVGVNRTRSAPSWNLDYAANDARQLSEVLSKSLWDTGQFGRVVPIRLVSDEDERSDEAPATKEHVKAVIERLAGIERTNKVRADVERLGRLEAARPEDLVVLAFSSHGYTDAAGTFHWVLHDVDQPQAVTPALDRSTLSSDELTAWLRPVDAGDMVLIVDACQSEATIRSDGFKPGPMGSRGLGQLAYDKRMLVLAASKSRESAFEWQSLRHGLLTYALVERGLRQTRADWAPREGRTFVREWLAFAEQEVPRLFRQAAATPDTPGRSESRRSRDGYLGKRDTPARYQQPTLFDFMASDREVLLSR
jgi:WD40 repeat protein